MSVRTLRTLLLVIPLLTLSCFAGEVPRTLILVSIDGFRADYLDLHPAPWLRETARSGLLATEGLVPVFPTKTFPSHWSLVTGLHPDRHGIVSNTIYDPERAAWFRIRDADAQRDPVWWGGEPLWITLERQGGTAATFFWVGSEARGRTATHSVPYDSSVAGAERVDRVLGWLDLPPRERPRFVTLYFSEVDAAGHRFGPESAETAHAVARVDAWLRRLDAGLAARGLVEATDLVVVSDHGMAATDPARAIRLEEHVDPTWLRIVETGPLLLASPRSDAPADLFVRLRDAHPRMRVFKREDLPERLRYSHHPRIPAWVALADDGWTIVPRRGDRVPKGSHGYDNRFASMRGLFLARGPSWRTGRVRQVHAVDLYEALCATLAIEPAPNEGSATAARALLAPQ